MTRTPFTYAERWAVIDANGEICPVIYRDGRLANQDKMPGQSVIRVRITPWRRAGNPAQDGE